MLGPKLHRTGKFVASNTDFGRISLKYTKCAAHKRTEIIEYTAVHTNGVGITARTSLVAVLHHEVRVVHTSSSDRPERTRFVITVRVRTFCTHKRTSVPVSAET